MKNYILQSYHQALRKYNKFAKRIQKRKENGTFQDLTIRKQRSLIARLQKLKSQVQALHKKIALAGLGIAMGATFLTSEAEAQVQTQFLIPLANPLANFQGDFSVLDPGPRTAVADLDKDGDLDIMVGNYDGNVLFYENDGNNNFSQVTLTTQTVYGYSGAAFPVAVDFDGDMDMDIFVGSDGGAALYFVNDGTADFRDNFTFEYNSNPLTVLGYGTTAVPAFGDVNGDEDLDLVVGEPGAIKFYLNDGSGNLVENNGLQIVTGSDSLALPALADIDGDGDDDLVYGIFLNAAIRYFENEGSSTFTQRNGNDNPFSIVDGISSPAPNLVDLDNDGDLDLFLGDRVGGYGIVNLFTNEGTSMEPKLNNILVSVPDPDIEPVPAFVNLDGDDDLDLFVGTADDAFYFQNDGANNFTQFRSNDNDNPLQGVVPSSAGIRLSPQFVDIDNDDDLDIFSGNRSGTIDYYINNGGTYTRISGAGNPLDGVDLGDRKRSKPAFVDIDGDEDFDVFIAEKDGVVFFYRNEGDKDTPNFVLQSDGNNPLGTSVVNIGDSTYVSPTFADYDNDGDFDFFIGYQFGEVGQPQGSVFIYQNNNGVFSQLTGDDNFLEGIVVGGYASPTFADLDKDGDLDLFIGERYGSVRQFTNLSPSDIFIESEGTEIMDGGSLNFGNVDLGSTGDTSVIVRNAGLSNLVLNQTMPFTITSGNPADILLFNVVPVGGFPSDFTIAPGDSLVFTLSFTPTTVGGKNISIIFNTNDPDESAFSLNVGGTGFDPNSTIPEVDVLQNTVNITANSTFDFGEVDTENGVDTVFTIRNNGGGDLTLEAPSLTGSTAFTISGDFPTGPVLSGQEASFTINFMPTDTTTQMAMLSFGNNDADENPYTINLVGKGAPITSLFEVNEGSLSIAPNPASDELRISLENVNALSYQLNLYSSQGELVFSEDVTQIQIEDTRVLKVSEFPSGIYILEMIVNKQVIRERIVID